MRPNNPLDQLIDELYEILGLNTVQGTIHFLKKTGDDDESIKKDLRVLHGLSELQASQYLKEYEKQVRAR